jgi:NCAIR mutase (PurE)-related protein
MNTPPVRLDLDRRRRLGLVEAVWGEHKSVDQLTVVLRQLRAAGEIAFVTRLEAGKEAALRRALAPGADPCWQYDPVARCLQVGPWPDPEASLGAVAVLCAGTSDLGVAREALLALRAHGVATELIADVGVAGLHRLLGELERLRRFRVLVVCAGMEGALPTVLAGLVPQPVIGVPVAVGYGVSAGGRTALEGMLASCAPGLLVVNIDNGYGAAMASLRMLRSVPAAAGAPA